MIRIWWKVSWTISDFSNFKNSQISIFHKIEVRVSFNPKNHDLYFFLFNKLWKAVFGKNSWFLFFQLDQLVMASLGWESEGPGLKPRRIQATFDRGLPKNYKWFTPKSAFKKNLESVLKKIKMTFEVQPGGQRFAQT